MLDMFASPNMQAIDLISARPGSINLLLSFHRHSSCIIESIFGDICLNRFSLATRTERIMALGRPSSSGSRLGAPVISEISFGVLVDHTNILHLHVVLDGVNCREVNSTHSIEPFSLSHVHLQRYFTHGRFV
jgi:hypothetical protein